MTAMTLRLPTPEDISSARRNIADTVLRIPLVKLNAPAPEGVNIWLKLENLQPLGSFKIRPALNALRTADPAHLERGILTSSAGNFGQGLSFAARQLGIATTVVIPEAAAQTKEAALRELGAKVIRVPFDTWWQVMTTRSFPGEHGRFIHPVSESAVIAGNATLGEEILEDLSQPDVVIAPFGGGGLSCGIGSVMRRLRPQVRMVVVESEAAQPAAAAFAHGTPTVVPHRPSFVDGMGSTRVLDEMWPLIRQSVDQTVCVSFDQIAAAIRLLATRHHVIAEAAGAAPVAAALAGLAGRGNIVCIVSGGNLDPPKLSDILHGRSPV